MDISNKEVVHLIRLALGGKRDDVAMLAKKIARKLRDTDPENAKALSTLARGGGGQSLARGKHAEQQMPVDVESRLELARVENHIVDARQPIWTAAMSVVMEQIVKERENEEALAQADLLPVKSMLFVGPPGVGKTLSARWLAKKLERPLVTLDLAAVMSSYLGRTGNNVRNVLDYAKGTGCVLLLDEFDAIAKRRDDVVEVGELKRLVTVLLQEIDNWPASGILIAATNYAELLDPAIWRRFDTVVNFQMPEREEVLKIVERLLTGIPTRMQKVVAVVLQGLSFSDIEREILRAKRFAVIEDRPLEECLERLIVAHAHQKRGAEKTALAIAMVESGFSQRQAHELTGVSRDTIRSHMSNMETE